MLVRDNVAFIHPYKTGGTSIRNYLSNYGFVECGEAHSCARHHDINGYFVVSVIRPPHDRVVSIYHYLRGWKAPLMHIIKTRKLPKDTLIDANIMSFHNFVLKWGGRLGEQYNFYIDINGNYVVDYMIRLPHADDDFSKLCEKIGVPQGKLPHKHKSGHRPDIRSYYTDETWNLVSNHFVNDMTEYEKWNKIHDGVLI